MAAMFIILASLAAVTLTNGQTINSGKCPTGVYVQSSFDASKYVGTWYVISQIPEFFQIGYRCSKAELTALSGDLIGVNNTATSSRKEFRQKLGNSYAPDASEPAKLIVNLEGVPIAAPYWVLSTDYINYSVVYACLDIPGGHTEFAYVQSRQPTLDANFVPTIKQVFQQNGLQKPFSKLRSEVQKNCVN